MTGANEQGYDADQLSLLVGLPRRTIRYYIQLGLVPAPEGETRAARYGQQHVERLLAIKKWTQTGFSLERIRDLIEGGDSEDVSNNQRPGEVRVWSRVMLDRGLELHVEPGSLQMSPEDVRELSDGVLQLVQKIKRGKS